MARDYLQLATGTRLTNAWTAARFWSDARLAVVDALRGFAEARGHSVLDLAMSWLARHAVVTSVIAGSTTPEQVLMNIDAARVWHLTDAELAEIDRIAPLAPS